MCKKRSFSERVQHQRLRQRGQLEERQLCTWTKRLNTEGSNQSWWVVHNIHAHSHSKRKRKFKYARCTVRENTRTLNTEHRTPNTISVPISTYNSHEILLLTHSPNIIYLNRMVDRSPDKYSLLYKCMGSQMYSSKAYHISISGKNIYRTFDAICVEMNFPRAIYLAKRPFSDWPFEFTHHIHKHQLDGAA